MIERSVFRLVARLFKEPRELSALRPPAGLRVKGERFGYVDGNGTRRFRSDGEGAAYGGKYLDGTYRSLSSEGRHAAREYSRDGRPYSYILRVKDPQAELDRMLGVPRDRQALITTFGKVPTLDDVYGRIAILDGSFRPLPERLEALRGINSIDYVKGYDGADPESLIGLTHTDDGYTSTSLGRTVVPTTPHPIRYVVHLDIPRGHPALWIGRHAIHPEQRELLLPRKVGYTFTNVVPRGDGTYDLFADVHRRGSTG